MAGVLGGALAACAAAIAWLAFELAAGDAPPPAAAPSVAVVGTSVQDAAVDAYVRRAVRRITDAGTVEELKRLKRMGAAGIVDLRLVIGPDGAVGQLVLRQSSGNARVDAATLDLVRKAAPFAPFPEDLRGALDGIEIPLKFDFDQLAAGAG